MYLYLKLLEQGSHKVAMDTRPLPCLQNKKKKAVWKGENFTEGMGYKTQVLPTRPGGHVDTNHSKMIHLDGRLKQGETNIIIYKLKWGSVASHSKVLYRALLSQDACWISSKDHLQLKQ